MSRQVKIIIFSCILLFSWYYKNYSPELLINKESEATPKPDPSRWDKYIVKDKDVIETPNSKIKTGNEKLNGDKKSTKRVNFELRVSKKKLGINQRLKADFVINQNGDDFSPPSFENFILVGGPNQSVRNSYTDGKKNFSKTFTFFLEPIKTGIIKIGTASIMFDGKKYNTNPVSIRVLAYEASKEKSKSSKNNSESFDIDSPDITDVPKTGDSPYDDYFGKGIYRDTKNYFIIHAPAKTHVVFILIDNSSGRRIRNEFIRKGEVFTMTKIPYGTYDYMYFTGRNWTNTVTLDKGRIRGGFMDYKSFKNNNQGEDQLKFKNGYYGSYTIKLLQTIGGNLKTKNITEDQFFN